jgi:hypothetical protein
MDVRELDRGEVIAIVGGIVLAVSVFLDWYTLGNRFAALNGCHGPDTSCTGWRSLEVSRFLLLAAAVAPLGLAWVIVRRHRLAWPRGELTAVIALLALTLIVFRGFIDRPGSPPGEISVGIGWFLALLGGLLILFGSVTRSRETTTRRRPRGVM